MDRPRLNNAFTLLEALLVLLIVSVCSLSVHSATQVPLLVFMKQMETNLFHCQQQAFAQKRKVVVQIGEQAALMDERLRDYPLGVSCHPQVLSFNANGNVSRATTVTCTNQTQQRKIVIQLGSGRMRIE
ncbi:MAG: hypothetical protein J6D18_02260 [Erysipelotrichaceae bacterium]|nr:hypothetical protein [Erysipelotrichaceae bacterium]